MSPSYTENVTGTGTKTLTIQGVSMRGEHRGSPATPDLQPPGSAPGVPGHRVRHHHRRTEHRRQHGLRGRGHRVRGAQRERSQRRAGPRRQDQRVQDPRYGHQRRLRPRRRRPRATITLDGVDLSTLRGSGSTSTTTPRSSSRTATSTIRRRPFFGESGDTITVVNNTFVNAGSGAGARLHRPASALCKRSLTRTTSS